MAVQISIGRAKDIRYIRPPTTRWGAASEKQGQPIASFFPYSAVFQILSHSTATAVIVLTAIFGASVAFAADDFPLAGTYTQNVPCKGDGTDAVADQVKISTKQIVSNVGTCTVQDIKHDGDTFNIQVECQFPAGPLMGNVSFTPRPDHTVDFVDRDGNYKAVLHRCPD
jgi:hypothetical protein